MHFSTLSLSLCTLAQAVSASPMTLEETNTGVSPSNSHKKAEARCRTWDSPDLTTWYDIYNIANWNKANDHYLAMKSLHSNLLDQLSDQSFLQFAWGIDSKSGKPFAMVQAWEMPKEDDWYYRYYNIESAVCKGKAP